MEQSISKLPELIRTLLKQRGLTEENSIRLFLEKSLKHLYDPFLMPDMHKAANRVASAVNQNETIYIYGDYDVDGISATALLAHFFKSLKLKVFPYIPDRFSEGYGLSGDGIRYLKKLGASLIISVDNGVNAHEAAHTAKELNIDLIVTDHHQIESTPVDALAVLNPHLPHCKYPFKHLTGVGVAFKFAHACLKTIGPSDINPQLVLRQLMDFVSLGTIADVAPLMDENRSMVSAGIKQIHNSTFPGIRALISPLLLENVPLTSTNLAFKIIPKINASGRMEHAKFAVRLLLSDSQAECLELSRKLHVMNESRKAQQMIDLSTAMNIIHKKNLINQSILVIWDKTFHQGVVGIIAARLAESYKKPALVIAHSEGNIWKGSCRTIQGVSILACLDGVRDLFITYGGHKDAAGLSISEENLLKLPDRINQFYHRTISLDPCRVSFQSEAEIFFSNIEKDYLRYTELLEPFGQGNPEPVFCTKRVLLVEDPRWMKGKHVRLTLNQEEFTYTAIGFNFDNKLTGTSLKKGDSIDIYYKVRFDYFNHQKRVQLFLEEISL